MDGFLSPPQSIASEGPTLDLRGLGGKSCAQELPGFANFWGIFDDFLFILGLSKMPFSFFFFF